MLKKLTKYVWFRDEKWKVHSVISPNKWDDFVILSRPLDEMAHPDGSTPTEMILVQAKMSTAICDKCKCTMEAVNKDLLRKKLSSVLKDSDDWRIITDGHAYRMQKRIKIFGIWKVWISKKVDGGVGQYGLGGTAVTYSSFTDALDEIRKDIEYFNRQHDWKEVQF